MIVSLPDLLKKAINFFLNCIYLCSIYFFWAFIQESFFRDTLLFTWIFLLRWFLLFWKVLLLIRLNRFYYFRVMNLLWNLFFNFLKLLSFSIALLTRLLFISFFYLLWFCRALWLTLIRRTIWIVLKITIFDNGIWPLFEELISSLDGWSKTSHLLLTAFIVELRILLYVFRVEVGTE